MPKPKKGGGATLGASLIKHKRKERQISRNGGIYNEKTANMYVSDTISADDKRSAQLRSIIDENDLDAFISSAIMAERDFTAEKQNLIILDAPSDPNMFQDDYNEAFDDEDLDEDEDFEDEEDEAEDYDEEDEEEEELEGKAKLQALGNKLERVSMMKKQQLKKKPKKEKLQVLRIPRRPQWDEKTTPEELNRNENNSFLEWRRDIAEHESNNVHAAITPFEKNLEVWRQLWRVIERSDIVVQIVDARNPLFFRCEDLEKYVKEVDATKQNVLVINKADYLPEPIRQEWAEYLTSQGVEFFFFSAKMEAARLDEQAEKLKMEAMLAHMEGREEEKEEESEEEEEDDEAFLQKARLYMQHGVEAVEAGEGEDEFDLSSIARRSKGSKKRAQKKKENSSELSTDQKSSTTSDSTSSSSSSSSTPSTSTPADSSSSAPSGPIRKVKGEDEVLLKAQEDEEYKATHLVDREKFSHLTKLTHIHDRSELLHRFVILGEEVSKRRGKTMGLKERVVVGMVGYPNVGKSSMINVLCAEKRVGVAAQPGKTKHFQTLQVGEKVTLCDCPGLVFPSFIVTRAEMVCSGVLPIDQLREFKSPVSLICQRLPRGVFEEVLRINIPPLKKDDDAATRISAEYMMQSYARCRGYFTGRGIPDESRVARMVLKEYTTGGLLFCHLPPTSKIRGLDAVALYYPFPSLLTALENKAKAAAAAAAVEDPNVFSAELREENEIESEKTFANEMMYPKEAGKPDKKHRPWKKEKKLMKNLRSQANFVYKDEVSFEHQNGVAARTAGRNGVANYIRTQYPFGRPAAASGTAPHPNSVPASSSSSSSAADAQAVKGKGRAVVFA